MSRCSAARVKLPSSATCTKYSSCFRFIGAQSPTKKCRNAITGSLAIPIPIHLRMAQNRSCAMPGPGLRGECMHVDPLLARGKAGCGTRSSATTP
jgi:hypothetical protein